MPYYFRQAIDAGSTDSTPLPDPTGAAGWAPTILDWGSALLESVGDQSPLAPFIPAQQSSGL
jgi:hypothetical protein